jgi:hypothetical protein
VSFSYTVVVPYEFGFYRGSCLLLSNLRPFHDELVKGVQVPFFLLPLLFSILVDPVRCGLSLSLVGVCFSFGFISSVPIVAMVSGSKEGESRVSYRLLALLCLSPCMFVPSLTPTFL